jgi:hypothetical protein
MISLVISTLNMILMAAGPLSSVAEAMKSIYQLLHRNTRTL